MKKIKLYLSGLFIAFLAISCNPTNSPEEKIEKTVDPKTVYQKLLEPITSDEAGLMLLGDQARTLVATKNFEDSKESLSMDHSLKEFAIGRDTLLELLDTVKNNGGTHLFVGYSMENKLESSKNKYQNFGIILDGFKGNPKTTSFVTGIMRLKNSISFDGYTEPNNKNYDHVNKKLNKKNGLGYLFSDKYNNGVVYQIDSTIAWVKNKSGNSPQIYLLPATNFTYNQAHVTIIFTNVAGFRNNFITMPKYKRENASFADRGHTCCQ
jgi:hypothetical protein